MSREEILLRKEHAKKQPSKGTYERQERMYGAYRNKKENRVLGRAVRRKNIKNFKRSHKNFTARHLVKSLSSDYKRTQTHRYSKTNLSQKAIKNRGKKARRRRKRMSNNLDRINHDVLHGFNWL